jgi:hypothetical protein
MKVKLGLLTRFKETHYPFKQPTTQYPVILLQDSPYEFLVLLPSSPRLYNSFNESRMNERHGSELMILDALECQIRELYAECIDYAVQYDLHDIAQDNVQGWFTMNTMLASGCGRLRTRLGQINSVEARAEKQQREFETQSEEQQRELKNLKIQLEKARGCARRQRNALGDLQARLDKAHEYVATAK